MLRNFSHLYVERDVLNQADTQQLLKRFSQAKIILIDNYKSIFSRPRQPWREQKSSTKLILAAKRDGLLYNGSPAAPNFNHRNFYYNSLILNCLYDCHYCYLQGMYPSANIVLFANSDDFFEATDSKLTELGSMYLCISYDTDLLAFENLLPLSSRWLEFARSRPNLTIELRTKSASLNFVQSNKALDRFILAWTLSPDYIQKRYESKTPSLSSRLAAVQAAIHAGWPVRLCFDPILAVRNWREIYTEFIERVSAEIPMERVNDLTFGVFRISSQYYRQLSKVRFDSDLIQRPFSSYNSYLSYSNHETQEIEQFMRNILADRINSSQIHSASI